ncbi:hypothetical protein F5Y16DRAFT_424765 [Xylariaceae sp. FL0255]|nr:hypothetical protein F5Y16DRAFT_424765 [Xylariaceae sp. FL0255]
MSGTRETASPTGEATVSSARRRWTAVRQRLRRMGRRRPSSGPGGGGLSMSAVATVALPPIEQEDVLVEEAEDDVDMPDIPPPPLAQDDDDAAADADEIFDVPPSSIASNRTTIGFEFEFLIAVAAVKRGENPHPTDTRWLSDAVGDARRSEEGFNHNAYAYTCRNKIIDVLRERGIVAYYMKEDPDLFAVYSHVTDPDGAQDYYPEGDTEFDWWDSLEDGKDVPASEEDDERGIFGDDRIDPSCAQLLGLKSQYYGWTCHDDCSLRLPEQVPTELGSDVVVHPKDHYFWWDPELISPILDYDHSETLDRIRTVCATLRDAFRVFKPHIDIRNGVHVHVGLEQGFTLLHAKKFATIFLFLEPYFKHLHQRNHPENESTCCKSVTAFCLGTWVYEKLHRYKMHEATTQMPDSDRYSRQSDRHVPFDVIDNELVVEHIHNIWQYDDVDDLTEHFAGRVDCREKGTIRMRMVGGKRSRRVRGSIDTIEFRQMRGTLDPDHVWRWAKICVRLVHFCRDSTRAQFKETVHKIIKGEAYPAELGFDQDDLAWFVAQQTDKDPEATTIPAAYFRLPDFAWAGVFMPPGAGPAA